MTRLSQAPDDKKRPPYFKYAFHNVYNYAALGGVLTTAVLTQNWWLGVVGLGAEVLWMVFSPDSRVVQKLWFDKVHAQKLADEQSAARAKLLGSLPSEDQDRLIALEQRRDAILRLCAENQALTQDLLVEELRKVDQLTHSFLDLIVSARRYIEYLRSVRYDQLEADLRRMESIAKQSDDEASRGLAKKNLDVLMRRKDKLIEINQYVRQAHGQMELIENTFRLLGDQIVTMRSPKELGTQLDELMDGVEAVKTTAREADALMQAVGGQ